VDVRYILHTPLGLYNKSLVWVSLYPPSFSSTLHPHFLLILSILQMANTSNRNANANNNAANSPPPPPPTLEQVLVIKAQMLQTIQQTMTNMQQNQQAPQPQHRGKLGEFQRTKSPTFSHSVEPMNADDWLKMVEKKLQVVQCNHREKVLLASHQLVDHEADWWDAYVDAHEEPYNIN
jgi:hypothetical protein